MITPSFALTATGRVLPRLTLNFTTASLDPRITFTRAGATATVVDSAGLIQPVAADTARFDYDPVTLACRGLLIEESRQNVILYSEDLTQTQWIKFGATISADAEVAPSGATVADKLVENTANSVHQLQQNATFTSGVTYTYSFYAKKAGRDIIRMHENILQGFEYAQFNLDTGVATILGPAVGWTLNAVSMRDAGNGWYRCIVTATPGSTVTNNAFITRLRLYNGTSTTYTGDGVSGIFFYGGQLEAGAFPTSYIPTTTTALTRNADVATMTGTNFSDFWQATKGGASVIATPSTVSGIRPLVQFDDGTVNEIIALRGNTTNPELQIVDGGAPQAQIDAGTIVANTPYGLTGWWQTNDCKARQNAGAVVSDYTATIPTVTQARLGSDGTNYLNGHLATINYYDRFTGQIYDRRKNKAVFSLL
jgi:hypothetical protein